MYICFVIHVYIILMFIGDYIEWKTIIHLQFHNQVSYNVHPPHENTFVTYMFISPTFTEETYQKNIQRSSSSFFFKLEQSHHLSSSTYQRIHLIHLNWLQINPLSCKRSKTSHFISEASFSFLISATNDLSSLLPFVQHTKKKKL